MDLKIAKNVKIPLDNTIRIESLYPKCDVVDYIKCPFLSQKIFENFTVTSVKSSEHQNKKISHNHQVMFALELTAEFINSLMTHLNNSNFDFVRKSRNKKNMHVLESGFLCCNVFILYFYRFA